MKSIIMNSKSQTQDGAILNEQPIRYNSEISTLTSLFNLLQYLLHGVFFLVLLQSVIFSIDNNPIALGLYLFLCLTTLWTASTESLSQSLNLLALIVSYQSVTMYLFPVLREYLFFTLFLTLVSLIIGIRFARRLTVFSSILMLIAIYGGMRFLFSRDHDEFYAAAQFFSAAMIGMVLVSNPLRKDELFKIIGTLCLAITGVVLLSIVSKVMEVGWFSFFSGALFGDDRLGTLDSMNQNSFAYLCFVGYSCGIVLLLNQRRPQLAWLAIFICGIAILLTKSRSSIVVMLAYPLILFSVYPRKAKGLIILLGCVILAVIIPFALENEMVRTILRLDLPSMYEGGERIVVWQEVISMIKQNLWTGISHVEYAQNSQLFTFYQYANGGMDVKALTPHNIVLSYLLFYGIILGGMMVIYKIYILWNSYRRNLTFADRALVLIPILGFIIHLTVDMWFFVYLFVLMLITASCIVPLTNPVAKQTLAKEEM
jgi:hypothetical protein